MPVEKNYYEILGVSKTATTEQIKKRYRQLVREHHPDVAEDKTAAKAQFLRITEAYQALIHPDRRLLYDGSLSTPSYRPPSSRPAQSARPSGARPSGARPSGARPSGARPSGAQARTAQTQSQTTRNTRTAEVQRWMREAENAFAAGQFRSAIYASKEAVRLDPRNARAHVILGDIYRVQGLTDEAVAMYTIAVQLDPRNVDVQTKLDRLIRRSAPQREETGETTERHASLKIGLNLVGLAALGFALFFLLTGDHEPIRWLRLNLGSIAGTWSWGLITVMLIAGWIAGFLLSVNGAVNRMDEELLIPSVRSSGVRSVSYPMGLLLVVFNFFSFYLAVLVYFISGLVQENISKSVVWAFGMTFVVTLLMAALYPAGWGQVLLFGGNVVFPSLLVGWMVGDIFRPGW